MEPTTKQKEFIEVFASLVNVYLKDWGKSSGKTVARKMLAERILKDDE
jgi:hypothetical protein